MSKKDSNVKESIASAEGSSSEGNKMPARKGRATSCSSSSSAAGSPTSPDTNSLNRQQRNLAEKQRRDKLNNYINEIASLVPMVSRSVKKLDKTSVLRLAAAHLRLHYSSLNDRNKKKISWKPKILDSENLNELQKIVEGFLVVATIAGKVLFASKFVENFLGHLDIEMIGHSLFYFIHPDDHIHVKNELKKLVNSAKKSENENHARATFCARMRERSQPRSEVVNYQLMGFGCSFTIEENKDENPIKRIFNVQRIKSGSDSNAGLFKLYIQSINPNPFDELSIIEAFQDQYVTQHGPLGEILYADHRISTITGHLPHEVIGMGAYDYIFEDDIPVAQFAQELMFSSSNGTGIIVYRLKTRNSLTVYLKTTGHLQYDKSSTKVSHFICFNKLLSKEEGEEELKSFKERFSPHISKLISLASQSTLSIKGRCSVDSQSSLSEDNLLPISNTPSATFQNHKSLSQVNGSDVCQQVCFPNNMVCQNSSPAIICAISADESQQDNVPNILEEGKLTDGDYHWNNHTNPQISDILQFNNVTECSDTSENCNKQQSFKQLKRAYADSSSTQAALEYIQSKHMKFGNKPEEFINKPADIDNVSHVSPSWEKVSDPVCLSCNCSFNSCSVCLQQCSCHIRSPVKNNFVFPNTPVSNCDYPYSFAVEQNILQYLKNKASVCCSETQQTKVIDENSFIVKSMNGTVHDFVP